MTDTVKAAKKYAVQAWYLFANGRQFQAKVPDWRVGSTPDGAPRLSVEVVGPDAAAALHVRRPRAVFRPARPAGSRSAVAPRPSQRTASD
jgi:hypothetical protein